MRATFSSPLYEYNSSVHFDAFSKIMRLYRKAENSIRLSVIKIRMHTNCMRLLSKLTAEIWQERRCLDGKTKWIRLLSSILLFFPSKNHCLSAKRKTLFDFLFIKISVLTNSMHLRLEIFFGNVSEKDEFRFENNFKNQPVFFPLLLLLLFCFLLLCVTFEQINVETWNLDKVFF